MARVPAAGGRRGGFGEPRRRRGDRNDGTGPVRAFVPDGTRFMFAPQPSDKSLGYFRASLRDVESQHAKQIPHPMGEGRGEGNCASISEVAFERILRDASSSFLSDGGNTLRSTPS